jgi:hypothetical protein
MSTQSTQGPRGPSAGANGSDGQNMVQAASLAGRIAAAAGLRAAGWGLETSMRVSSRVLRAALSGESPAILMRELGPEMRRLALRMLDIADQVDGGEPVDAEDITDADEVDPDSDGANGTGADGRPRQPPPTLRERGEDLLRRSAELHGDDGDHPAYERILVQLAPDEARILRLLATDGAQPSVDVRSAGALKKESELVAAGLNMVGSASGSRRMSRVPAYLNNLERLGLIWFSRESVGDEGAYQVLEAQPEVLEAMRAAGRGRKIVRRSIGLTPLGVDFCKACLPLTPEELEALDPPPQFNREKTDGGERRDMP